MRKQKALALVILITGVTLEVVYYYSRFLSEGASWWLSLIQSIALTCFLMGAFILARKNPIMWFIVVPLAMYSIFNTAAGNRSSLIAKAQAETVGINNDQIAELEKTLSRKQAAYDADFGIIQFDSIEERAKWRSTVSTVKDDIDEKESEIDAIEEQIRALKNVSIGDSKISGVYEFYSSFIPVSADALQMILQFALSFFIALMAPSALILFEGKQDENLDYFVKHWVNASWIGVRQGREDKALLSKEKYLKFAEERGIAVTSELYDRIKKASERAKVVDNGCVTVDNETEAIKAIIRRI